MANTIASHISAHFIIKGTPIYKYGKLASTYSPCYWVYESSTGTWTAIDADTAGTIIMNYGCIGYKERILSTGAKSSIDSAYATTDTGIPILIGFQEGEGQFVAYIDDPAATIQRNATFVVSETESAVETGAGVTAKLAAGDPKAPVTNVEVLVTGDLFMWARWLAT